MIIMIITIILIIHKTIVKPKDKIVKGLINSCHPHHYPPIPVGIAKTICQRGFEAFNKR
jgi:hypothetical protein